MDEKNLGKWTASGVVEYLDLIVEKGRASPGAITPLKTACVKVFEAVNGEEWGQATVKDIDVDDYIARFANLTRGTYSVSSVSVYKSRLSRVLGWYEKFMSADQAGWMPTLSSRGSKQSSTKQPTSKATKLSTAVHSKKQEHSPVSYAAQGAANAELINYPFPLSQNRMGAIQLPTDIVEDDAERIASFVKSLVVKTPKLLGQGTENGNS